MKRLIYCLLLMVMCCQTTMAQDVYDDYLAKPEKQTDKKAEKNRAKELQALTDSVDFKFACAALRKGYFVLQATRIDIGNMRAIESGLDENTNFVYQQGKEGVVQVAFPGADPGLNGFGGITCRGTVTNGNFSIDKKGNAHYDFSIMGDINAHVMITVYAQTKRAEAFIDPTFESSNMAVTMYGDLVPYKRD